MSEGPRIGSDEWVARHEERRTTRGGWLGIAEARLAVVPARPMLFVAVICLLPVGVENGYVRRVAFDTVIFMLLALGLNVVVGWGGLLDLGYVAFFGIGAYGYALLVGEVRPPPRRRSVIVVVCLIGALAGFLVGLPSRRLTGDYLAIVTLFFFQAFLTVTNNGDDIFGRNVTNGPNGILDIDEFGLFGRRSRGPPRRAVRHRLPVRRTGGVRRRLRRAPPPRRLADGKGMAVAARGRARRRGDGDARQRAEADGVRVRRRDAALTGTLVASLNGSVFPQDFEFPLLIAVYTMVILGGAGSRPASSSARFSSACLEVLREPGDSRAVLRRDAARASQC